MTSMPRFVVTIDGAAGTGKTSVAQELARRLGTDCLDTGAMYRAIAVLSVDHGIAPDDGVALAELIQELGIRFDWNHEPASILLGGVDVSSRIRDLDVSGVVSIVAKQPEVRKVLVEQQRRIGEEHPLLVTEGRDQGSIVFPDAEVRFFLEAKMDERTKRRVKQLRESGKNVENSQIFFRTTNLRLNMSKNFRGPILNENTSQKNSRGGGGEGLPPPPRELACVLTRIDIKCKIKFLWIFCEQ